MASTDPSQLSPKVLTPALVSAGLLFLSLFLSLVTPELFAGLGPWAVPLSTALVGVGAFIAGFVKQDPLRTPNFTTGQLVAPGVVGGADADAAAKEAVPPIVAGNLGTDPLKGHHSA